MVFGIIPECRSVSRRNERSPSPESPDNITLCSYCDRQIMWSKAELVLLSVARQIFLNRFQSGPLPTQVGETLRLVPSCARHPRLGPGYAMLFRRCDLIAVGRDLARL